MSFAHGLRPEFRFPNGLLNYLHAIYSKSIIGLLGVYSLNPGGRSSHTADYC